MLFLKHKLDRKKKETLSYKHSISRVHLSYVVLDTEYNLIFPYLEHILQVIGVLIAVENLVLIPL